MVLPGVLNIRVRYEAVKGICRGYGVADTNFSSKILLNLCSKKWKLLVSIFLEDINNT